MTWAEFQIRLFAFNRMDKRQWIHTREVAYYSYIGGLSGAFGKVKIPSKKNFMDLGLEKNVKLPSKENLDFFKQELEAYNNRNNGK